MNLSEKVAVIPGGGTRVKIKDLLSQGIMKLMIILHERFVKISGYNKQNKTLDSVAEDLALGLNGRLERGGPWKGMPNVYIDRKDIPAQISFFLMVGQKYHSFLPDSYSMALTEETLLFVFIIRESFHGLQRGLASEASKLATPNLITNTPCGLCRRVFTKILIIELTLSGKIFLYES
ncbi:MAG: hypothetical protein M0Z67_16015 [Nitrospiraceae bacterium]|nr:hypothetical protein [Nitrospiraceae bacterium]